MTERRKFLRFETAISALCEIVSRPHAASSKVKNISKGGALISLSEPLREGSELKLSMDVPGDNVPIFASCQVAWQKKSGPKDEFETGVRFTKIDNADRGKLLEYIYSQWLRLLDKE